MHRGYVNLWRKTMDSQFFSTGLKQIGLFSYLLLKANWKVGWFMGQKINPGQFGTSITHLADAVGEHRHTVKKLLQDLSNQSMITRENVFNRWVKITICNWATYQGADVFNNPTKIQPDSNQSPTTCQQSASSLPQSNKGNHDNHDNHENQSKADPVNPPEKKPKQTRFIPPTIKEVEQYCRDRKNRINAQKFIDHYTTTGWMRGKNKIKDWKACVRTWEGNGNNRDPEADRAKQKVEEDRKLARADKYLKGHGINAEAKRL